MPSTKRTGTGPLVADAAATELVNFPVGPADAPSGPATGEDAAPARVFDDARLHEIETASYTEDVAYWERLLDELQPASVLELGCGSGRLFPTIVRRGLEHRSDFRLVGLDLSPALLAAAERRLAEDQMLRDTTSLVHADMTEFALEERFDLVIIAFNGLAFVTGVDGQRRCLDAVRDHLAPGGRLAIDMLVPRVSYLAISERTSPVRLGLDLHDPAPGVARLLRFDTERYDPVHQVDNSVHQYELHHADGRVERFVRDLAWQMTFPNELGLLMEHAGLQVLERYGDYERSPFDRTSHLYLWVAGRADEVSG